jgi:acyl-CoA thioester hydrolase
MPLIEDGEHPRVESGWFRWEDEVARVKPEWVDSNDHLNMGYYLVVFDQQTDRLWPVLGLGRSLRAQGLTTFAVEAWLDYQREMREGDLIGAESRILQFDAKRLMIEHRMFHHAEGWTSSAHEALFLCVDVVSRKVAAWPEEMVARFAGFASGAEPRRLTLRKRG